MAIGLACRLPITAALVLTWTSAGAQFVYDFEDLKAGRIVGQDAWTSSYLSGAGAVVANGAAETLNESRVVTTVGRSYEQIVRTMNRRPFGGLEQAAFIQFDFCWDRSDDASGILFKIGTDVNGDGSIGFKTSPQRDLEGVGIRIQRGRFGMDNENIGPSGSRILLDAGETSDWYRIRLRMNFTADDGAGAGTVEYMNLTRGDDAFTVAASGTLDLDQLASGAPVMFWDTIMLSLGEEAEIDNLVVGITNPP